jgi:hypothetical protein
LRRTDPSEVRVRRTAIGVLMSVVED